MMSSYSPTQEELENLCFVTVDPCTHKLWAFVYITSKPIIHDRSFFAFICSEVR